MGRVFLAQDPNIDRRVALKVAEPLQAAAGRGLEELQQRFVLEARAAGRLNHPGIVTVYDAATDPETGISFIAMEWVEGQSLAALLESSEPLPLEEAVRIIAHVAAALDSAHASGLIHRDVKPANILLSAEGQAKISDFGIAKFASLSTTATGQIVGSPYYMSPEQIRNEPLDGRSDLFSLGVVLYQCVTGLVPFAGDSLAAITYKILEIDPTPSQTVNPGVPPGLTAIIGRALAKSPAERYQSGLELAEALQALDLDGGALDGLGAEPAAPDSLPAGTAGGDSTGLRRGRSGTLLLSAPEAAATDSADRSARRRQSPPPLSRRSWAVLAGLAVAAVLALWAISGQSEPERPLPAVTGQESDDRSAGQETAPPPTPGMANLRITYKNRLRSATLSVWLDGEEMWSQPVIASKGLLKRAAGEEVRVMLQVPEGNHRIRVRVQGSAGKLGGSKSIEGVFREGEQRSLGVQLIPPDVLRLTWKD